MSKRLELGATWVIIVLAAGASLAGLMAPGLYRDPGVLLPQIYGQDLVTLVLGVPLLVAGMIGVARGSMAGRILWLGASDTCSMPTPRTRSGWCGTRCSWPTRRCWG